MSSVYYYNELLLYHNNEYKYLKAENNVRYSVRSTTNNKYRVLKGDEIIAIINDFEVSMSLDRLYYDIENRLTEKYNCIMRNIKIDTTSLKTIESKRSAIEIAYDIKQPVKEYSDKERLDIVLKNKKIYYRNSTFDLLEDSNRDMLYISIGTERVEVRVDSGYYIDEYDDQLMDFIYYTKQIDLLKRNLKMYNEAFNNYVKNIMSIQNLLKND